MFDNLSERLDGIFKRFRDKGRLDEQTIQEGLREVRLALLEADVNYRVVKDFIETVRERAMGQEVMASLTPGQQVVKIVHEELVQLLGGANEPLSLKGSPGVVMLVGLQGSGKTTTAAKLALHLQGMELSPYLVPADVYRPAAIDQLQQLGSDLQLPVFPSTSEMDPVDICDRAVREAGQKGSDVVLLDTAGRLHVNEELMQELAAIRDQVHPREMLLVADSMTGQDAVNVAQSFHERLDLSGVILTKMEGDARGGAALSIRSILQRPIKFVGVGEKLKDLEAFHPDRVANRILGMGDVLTLIEKAQNEYGEEESEDLQRKMEKASFDLEDFRSQMRKIRKMGSIDGLLKLMPGMGQIREQLQDVQMPEKELSRIESIINSMTPWERHRPKTLNTSRKERIAKGSGTTQQDVNDLLKKFNQMQKMMKKFSGKKNKAAAAEMAGIPGMPGMEEAGMGAPSAGKGKGSSSTKKNPKRKKREKQKKKKKK
ncbi:MAG: signal recognition particle protein [Desulfohalobiaceae bacterium]|nr:signal recognition particle protein [Desulfohalobiaceae bacterium]